MKELSSAARSLWSSGDARDEEKGACVEAFDNGVEVFQATRSHGHQDNIYCEHPWCPRDGSGFVFRRHHPEVPRNPNEFVFCRFDSWEEESLGFGSGGCDLHGDLLYYAQLRDDDRPVLVRHDLTNGDIARQPCPDDVPAIGGFAVDPTGRYLAYREKRAVSPQYAISVLDLATERSRLLYEDDETFNPHLQFDPGPRCRLLVQHNRGSRFNADGSLDRIVGPEGCTLFLLGVPDGSITRLPIGPPHTASVSGHETWIGDTGAIVATLNVEDDYDRGKGPLVRLLPGSASEEICSPWQMNHVGVEPSGRIFCADTCTPDAIIVGSPWNEQTRFVCPARASYTRGLYDSHPHAYIAPGLRWVVFNSDRTGDYHVYAARLPAEMTGALLEEPA